MEDDFRVRTGTEAPALGDQLVAQFDIVEDFAIEDSPHRPVLVRNGLIAGGEVDDAQPCVAEARTPVRRGPDRLGIGTAVHEAGRRTREVVRGNSTTR